jgi:peptide/nickel transport system substrate-binding protein
MRTHLARTLAVGGLAALAVALVLARSTRLKPRVARAAARGGQLVSSLRAEPRTFNSYFATDAASHTLTLLTQAPLVRVNRASQQLEPWLADRWSASADRLTYTLHLRPGVRFSDGSPFSSADVLFSFDAAYADSTGSPAGQALRVAGRPLAVSAPGPLTVVIRFPSPYGPGLRILDGLPILPRHRLDPALRAGRLRDAWTTTARPSDLAGLGPFVLHEYVPGERMALARNPYYWRVDESGLPLPRLDRLVLDIVPDQDAEALRLEAGQSDFLSSEIRLDDYAAFKEAEARGRLRLIDLGVGLDPSFLWFNLNDAAKGRDPRRAWLQSVALRRAISSAVDRQAFANTVFLGAGLPVHGPVTPGNRTWFVSDLPRDTHDLAAARRLLASVGLEDRNRDGLVEDAAGRAARFTLLTQKGHTARERGAAVIQHDLRALGLQVEVVALEVGSLVSRLMSRDYDAIYFGTQTTDTDPSAALEFWLSSGAFHAWNLGQTTPATEWEREIDRLMLRQSAVTDQAERGRLFAAAQRIFAEQAPALYFAAPRVYVALGARVAHATPALHYPHVLWNAELLAARPDRP